MKKNEQNWQEQAQDAIYDTIKDMSRAEELDYWQQETARMRARRHQTQNEPDRRLRLTALLQSYPRNRSAR